MKITKILLAIAIMLGFTSCLDSDGNDQTITTNLYEVFNVVEDTQKGTVEAVNGVSYEMEFNYNKKLVNLSINGLQLSQASPSYTVAAQNVSFSINEQDEIVINIPSMTNGSVTVTDFKMKIRRRMAGLNDISVFNITYKVNGGYNVRGVQKAIFYFGDTETTILGTPSVFQTDATYYAVTFDPTVRKDGKSQARLFMYDAKFAPKMPEMNLMLLELYADFTLDGYTISESSAKVYTGTVQNPKEEPDYAVTDFSLSGVFATGVEFEYTAAGRFKSSAKCGYTFTEGVLN